MRLMFFALLAVNVAVLVLQLTVWAPSPRPVQDDGAGAPAAEAPGVARLELLPAAAKGSAADSKTPSKPTQGAPETQKKLCTMVGPFAETPSAKQFAERLRALEVGADVQQTQVPEGKGYWVYLPPAVSKAQALRRLHQVQSQGIDSYLIPRGDLANGISLGMFTKPALADARRAALKDKGYKHVKIKEITRTREETWVSLDRREAQKIGNDTWDKLLEQEKGVEKQQNYCQGVASG